MMDMQNKSNQSLSAESNGSDKKDKKFDASIEQLENTIRKARKEYPRFEPKKQKLLISGMLAANASITVMIKLKKVNHDKIRNHY